jgi:hypothetical protein
MSYTNHEHLAESDRRQIEALREEMQRGFERLSRQVETSQKIFKAELIAEITKARTSDFIWLLGVATATFTVVAILLIILINIQH